MDGPEKITLLGGIDIPLSPHKLINQHDYLERKSGEALHSSYIHLESKKGDTRLLSISSRNMNRFS